MRRLVLLTLTIASVTAARQYFQQQQHNSEFRVAPAEYSSNTAHGVWKPKRSAWLNDSPPPDRKVGRRDFSDLEPVAEASIEMKVNSEELLTSSENRDGTKRVVKHIRSLEPSGYEGGNEGNNLEAWQSVQSNQDGVFPDGYDGLSAMPRTLINDNVGSPSRSQFQPPPPPRRPNPSPRSHSRYPPPPSRRHIPEMKPPGFMPPEMTEFSPLSGDFDGEAPLDRSGRHSGHSDGDSTSTAEIVLVTTTEEITTTTSETTTSATTTEETTTEPSTTEPSTTEEFTTEETTTVSTNPPTTPELSDDPTDGNDATDIDDKIVKKEVSSYTAETPVAPPFFENTVTSVFEEPDDDAFEDSKPVKKSTLPNGINSKRSTSYANPLTVDNAAAESRNTKLSCLPCAPGTVAVPPKEENLPPIEPLPSVAGPYQPPRTLPVAPGDPSESTFVQIHETETPSAPSPASPSSVSVTIPRVALPASVSVPSPSPASNVPVTITLSAPAKSPATYGPAPEPSRPAVPPVAPAPSVIPTSSQPSQPKQTQPAQPTPSAPKIPEGPAQPSPNAVKTSYGSSPAAPRVPEMIEVAPGNVEKTPDQTDNQVPETSHEMAPAPAPQPSPSSPVYGPTPSEPAKPSMPSGESPAQPEPSIPAVNPEPSPSQPSSSGPIQTAPPSPSSPNAIPEGPPPGPDVPVMIALPPPKSPYNSGAGEDKGGEVDQEEVNPSERRPEISSISEENSIENISKTKTPTTVPKSTITGRMPSSVNPSDNLSNNEMDGNAHNQPSEFSNLSETSITPASSHFGHDGKKQEKLPGSKGPIPPPRQESITGSTRHPTRGSSPSIIPPYATAPTSSPDKKPTTIPPTFPTLSVDSDGIQQELRTTRSPPNVALPSSRPSKTLLTPSELPIISNLPASRQSTSAPSVPNVSNNSPSPPSQSIPIESTVPIFGTPSSIPSMEPTRSTANSSKNHPVSSKISNSNRLPVSTGSKIHLNTKSPQTGAMENSGEVISVEEPIGKPVSIPGGTGAALPYTSFPKTQKSSTFASTDVHSASAPSLPEKLSHSKNEFKATPPSISAATTTPNVVVDAFENSSPAAPAVSTMEEVTPSGTTASISQSQPTPGPPGAVPPYALFPRTHQSSNSLSTGSSLPTSSSSSAPVKVSSSKIESMKTTPSSSSVSSSGSDLQTQEPTQASSNVVEISEESSSPIVSSVSTMEEITSSQPSAPTSQILTAKSRPTPGPQGIVPPYALFPRPHETLSTASPPASSLSASAKLPKSESGFMNAIPPSEFVDSSSGSSGSFGSGLQIPTTTDSSTPMDPSMEDYDVDLTVPTTAVTSSPVLPTSENSRQSLITSIISSGKPATIPDWIMAMYTSQSSSSKFSKSTAFPTLITKQTEIKPTTVSSFAPKVPETKINQPTISSNIGDLSKTEKESTIPRVEVTPSASPESTTVTEHIDAETNSATIPTIGTPPSPLKPKTKLGLTSHPSAIPPWAISSKTLAPPVAPPTVTVPSNIAPSTTGHQSQQTRPTPTTHRPGITPPLAPKTIYPSSLQTGSSSPTPPGTSSIIVVAGSRASSNYPTTASIETDGSSEEQEEENTRILPEETLSPASARLWTPDMISKYISSKAISTESVSSAEQPSYLSSNLPQSSSVASVKPPSNSSSVGQNIEVTVPSYFPVEQSKSVTQAPIPPASSPSAPSIPSIPSTLPVAPSSSSVPSSPSAPSESTSTVSETPAPVNVNPASSNF